MKINDLSCDGVITLWSLTEFTDIAVLRTGLMALGLEKFTPEHRTTSAALKDALVESFPGKDRKVERLEDREAFEVIQVVRGERSNSYTQLFTAAIVSETIKFDPYLPQIATAVTENYNRHLGLVRVAHVTKMLTGIIRSWSGLCLRDGGAAYWLPSSAVERWSTLAAAVKAANSGGRISLFRHSLDPDAIEGVLNALESEINTDVRKMHEELDAGELGSRALLNREAQAVSMREKIMRYERILNRPLPGLATAVEEADVAVSKAALLLAASNAA